MTGGGSAVLGRIGSHTAQPHQVFAVLSFVSAGCAVVALFVAGLWLGLAALVALGGQHVRQAAGRKVST